MQHHLIGLNAFAYTDVSYHFSCQLTAFHIINVPTNDLAAKNIDEEIQVKIDAHNSGWQITDVPTE